MSTSNPQAATKPQNSQSLAVRDASAPMAIVPTSIEQTATVAAMFAKSQLVPTEMRGKESDVFFAIMFGLELGLPPASSMRSISIVKGKPFLDAQTAHALCLRHPECEFFRRKTDECVPGKVAVFETRRAGAYDKQSFSIDEAKAAQLIKTDGGWSKYPDRMLEARAKMILARNNYPEKLNGIYCPEESSDFADAPPAPASAFVAPSNVIDIDEVSQKLNEAAANMPGDDVEANFVELLAAISAAKTNNELTALRSDCAALKAENEELGKQLLSAYNSKRAGLKAKS